MMNRTTVNKIFQQFKQHNPEPTTELNYQTPFELLIAVILSAQATDKSVNLATEKLFAKYNTPQTLLKLGEDGLIEKIKSIGLYRTKAKNIIKTCQILIERFAGEVPRDRQSLESLPGVGRKTANVILNTLYHQHTIAVDTHVFRVSQRIGLAQAKTPHELEEKLMKVIPKNYLPHAHHWLILHGRYICVARKPKCDICFINQYCEYFKGLKEEKRRSI